MKLGYVGLGKMGKNMVLRLLEKNYQVVAWNRSPEPREEVAQAGAQTVDTFENLVRNLETPRTIWLMLPAGEITDVTIGQLSILLDKGDTLINGANEYFKKAVQHAHELDKKGIHYIDVGVSGGQDGARNGATLMIGGERETYEKIEGLFKDLAAPEAYQFFSGHGVGHFVKMVHNGIEYGMMQAIAEGFDILKQSDFDIDLKQVARVYNQKSIIESRLIGWLLDGFEEFGINLDEISGSAGSGGAAGMDKSEAKWTIDIAKELGISANNIESAVEARINSQKNPNFQGKVINSLRYQFGGHKIK